MKATIMIVLILVAAGEFWLAEALRCAPCKQETCVPPTDCLYGTGPDVCFCCTRCYKGPGERCGGAWNTQGECGKGLKCEKEIPANPDPYDEFNADGICVDDS